MPSSSSRSTVSSWAVSASAIASSGSETQNASLRLVRGRRDDEHLGALDLVAERRAQQVGVDRLGREDEQLHRVRRYPLAPDAQTAQQRSS